MSGSQPIGSRASGLSPWEGKACALDGTALRAGHGERMVSRFRSVAAYRCFMSEAFAADRINDRSSRCLESNVRSLVV